MLVQDCQMQPFLHSYLSMHHFIHTYPRNIHLFHARVYISQVGTLGSQSQVVKVDTLLVTSVEKTSLNTSAAANCTQYRHPSIYIDRT